MNIIWEGSPEMPGYVVEELQRGDVTDYWTAEYWFPETEEGRKAAITKAHRMQNICQTVRVRRIPTA